MEEYIERENNEPVLNQLKSLSESDWKNANWPILTYIPNINYICATIRGDSKDILAFWSNVFNPENFVKPSNIHKYDPKKHTLFILHSFKDREGNEDTFKAITTSDATISEDCVNSINYNYHGMPCENRGKSPYPTCNFWNDFHDQLSEEDQNKYPIPVRSWREKYIKENFLNRK